MSVHRMKSKVLYEKTQCIHQNAKGERQERRLLNSTLKIVTDSA